MSQINDTIVALATPEGVGAISIIRISGTQAFSICEQIFTTPKQKNISVLKSHTVHFGKVLEKNRLIDEVLVTIFRAPASYTGEDSIEISCHGSRYIQQKIITLLLENGCRMAEHGEFTLRAFLNGKLDLVQAEAVADLIASNSRAAHKVAIQQMRGGYSHQLQLLRSELLDFTSLLELELDFSEEDVEFVEKTNLMTLLIKMETSMKGLIASFSSGNAMKNGIPVVIVGKPNTGKSTLLNTLLNEDRAIVSEIAGTTRDALEDQIILDGVAYRFIDTAGIRESENEIEKIGIQKSFEKMEMAEVILYLFDATMPFPYQDAKQVKKRFSDKHIVYVANKIDAVKESLKEKYLKDWKIIPISAKKKYKIETLLSHIKKITQDKISGHSIMLSNIRHLEALKKSVQAIERVKQGVDNNLSGELLVIDIKNALQNIGIITGEITNDDILGNIFSKFCIGK